MDDRTDAYSLVLNDLLNQKIGIEAAIAVVKEVIAGALARELAPVLVESECSLHCPSVGRIGEELPHTETCKRARRWEALVSNQPSVCAPARQEETHEKD